MKFAHIADTHIKNLKYHKEYRAVFEQLYKTLKKEKVDCIVHCGDIAHTKTQISPEFVELCSDFLKNLANKTPAKLTLIRSFVSTSFRCLMRTIGSNQRILKKQI